MANFNQLYLDLSSYYDHFCRHIDYADQCEFANRVYKLFNGSNVQSYFDLACGTGQHLKYMHAYGFDVSGLDNSQNMLDQALLRVPSAKLICCDLAEFENQSEFDLITCFLYSLHYSHPISAYKQTLQRAYDALLPGGVLIFDLVDKLGIRNVSDMIDQVDKDGAKFSFNSRWHYRGEGEVLDLHLDITMKNDVESQSWKDHHIMTAVEISQVNEWMMKIGFQVTILERDFKTIREWDGKSSNVLMEGQR